MSLLDTHVSLGKALSLSEPPHVSEQAVVIAGVCKR